ncbi:MAG: tetratricopeptide repeat protein [Microcoleaceae cyanobacterium]
MSQRGLAYQAINQLEAAKTDFEQTIKLQPQNAEYWYNQGNILYHLRQDEAVINSYNKALELKPNDNSAW